MNKKMILMGIAGVLTLTAIVGGTLASTRIAPGTTASAAISTKNLGIAIGGTDDDNKLVINMPEGKKPTPGTEIPVEGLTITNDSSNGYNAYIRVRIYKIWEDQDGNPLTIDSDSDKETIKIQGYDDPDKWIVYDTGSNEDVELYYKHPVAPGSSTAEFITSIKTDENLGNDYADKNLYIEVEADAVQALEAEDNKVNAAGIMSAWGVTAEFDDGTNTIKSIN